MSSPQRSVATPKPAKESRTTDGDTRRQVMLLLLKDGPVTASHLGERLGLSAAGIRRHLDNLVEEELPAALRSAVLVAGDQPNTSASPIVAAHNSVTLMMIWPQKP